MDSFFEQELQTMLSLETFESQNLDQVIRQSAFVRYQRPAGFSNLNSGFAIGNGRNLNKRMIQILREIRTAAVKNSGVGSSQGYRHMISERRRRERIKQSYTVLHSMLPTSTKNDKVSIVQMASLQVQHLKAQKDELQRQNSELEAKLEIGNDRIEVAKIKLQVLNPSSAIDSMVGVLRCLKDMELKARVIQYKVSEQEFSAILDVETAIERAKEVEKAIEMALMEVESSFRESKKVE